MSILDALSKHSMFSETLDTLNRDPSTGHQMKGFDFAKNFPGAVPGGIYTPTSFLGPMLSKGYQYGQEVSKALLDGLGGITIGDALSKAKTQSDANIEGMLGKGFNMADYQQNLKDFNIDDVTFANSFGLRDLFNTNAFGKDEPMSIEDFQVQNIEDRPVASIPSNFLNYRFENARTPFTPLREGLFSVKNTLDNLKDKGVDVGSAIARGIGNLVIPGAGFLLSAMKETPEQKSVKDFYEKEFGLDDIGRVQSGIMAGYNPVYGFGGSGLQGAIDKRLATILKTEERKKKKGLKLSQELINRRKELEALKERDRIAKANIAATPGFDVSGGAGGSYDRSFDYGARTREARDRRSSDLGFSDIRLKENIELVGKSPSNINIYKFNYKDNPTTYQGVMAHEVPWANLKHSNGYMMVDYNKVDVEFKKWQR